MHLTVKAAAALIALAALSGAAQAGCRINLTISNPQPIQALSIPNGDTSETSVRSKGGVWRDLRKGGWFDHTNRVTIGANSSQRDTYRAGFGCDTRRRFRIEYRCARGGVTRFQYYPSSSGWTREQDINIELEPLC